MFLPCGSSRCRPLQFLLQVVGAPTPTLLEYCFNQTVGLRRRVGESLDMSAGDEIIGHSRHMRLAEMIDDDQLVLPPEDRAQIRRILLHDRMQQ